MGVFIPLNDGALATLIDASGHGLAAYKVSQVSRNTILNSSSREPVALMNELNIALRGSIGAAIAIARIFPEKIEFSGVGNVRASIDLKPLISTPGVVGIRMRAPKIETTRFTFNKWFLMHTDGLAHPKSIPGGNAETASKFLVEANASDHDDAGVLMARWLRKI